MEISQLFKNRLKQQWHNFAKYLKFVFNDHAVIAFFFLFGALLFAYQHLLKTLPVNIWTRCGLILILLLTLVLFRHPATFVKKADAVFFLGNESALQKLWQQAIHYSMVVNGLIELIMVAVFIPLMAKVFQLNLVYLILIMAILVIAKMFITKISAQLNARFENTQGTHLINWSKIAEAEAQRLASIYAFFNLFIDVPGLQSSIKQHPWFEKCRRFWPGYHSNGLVPLYITTFFRKSQYFNLWIRMTILGAILIPFTQGILLTILLALLEYLFIAQLIPLAGSYRRLIFDAVIPVSLKDRQIAFHQFAWPLIVIMNLIWAIVFMIFQSFSINSVIMLAILVIFGISLVFWYSDRIIANMFQRRVKHASKK